MQTDYRANRMEACRTHIELARLLMVLASAFVVAPPVLAAYLARARTAELATASVFLFAVSELLFISSVLSGYIVVGLIASSQDEGSFNAYRPATRIFSVGQLGAYVFGLICFLIMVFIVIL